MGALDGLTSSKVTRQEKTSIYFEKVAYIGYGFLQGNRRVGLHNLLQYHASMSLRIHLVLVSDWLKIAARNPGGAKRTCLKSGVTSKTWYTDSWGWVRDVRSIFNVSSACLINLHHDTDRKISSHVMRPAIAWFMKICITRSTSLMQWLCGSIDFSFIVSSSGYFLNALKATF